MYGVNGDFGFVKVNSHNFIHKENIFTFTNCGWHKCNDKYRIEREKTEEGTVFITLSGEGAMEIDGVKYTVVEYEDGTLNYFVDKTLIKTEAPDGSVIYYDEISTEVSAAYFVPPSGYTEDELTLENLNKYTSVIETTAE